MARDPEGVAWLGPTVVALALLAAAGLATTLLLRPSPVRSFPDDHGVTSADAEWVRCAAETVERHPGPFAAQEGFEVEIVDSRRALVRSALLVTEVQLVEGHLSYWRFQGWHTVGLDCPATRPQGS